MQYEGIPQVPIGFTLFDTLPPGRPGLRSLRLGPFAAGRGDADSDGGNTAGHPGKAAV